MELLESNTGPEKYYFDNLAAGRFMIQRCGSCSQAVFYPRNVCPHCGGMSLDWFEPTGNGTVYATTMVHTGTDGKDTYNVCLVDLEEGVRMMAHVADIPASSVTIGMPVRARVQGSGNAAKVIFEAGQG